MSLEFIDIQINVFSKIQMLILYKSSHEYRLFNPLICNKRIPHCNY